MIVVTASKIKNSFGKYLDLARIHGVVQIKRYGHVIAELVGVDDNVAEDKLKKDDKNSIET